MATRKTTARKTTRTARATCQCPLCAGTVATASGVYPCRASTWIEYVIVVDGEYLGTRATELSAKTELNAYRRDQLTAPVEAAAADADIEADVAAFVAEVAAAQTPAELPAYIYYSVTHGGFVYGDCARPYNTYTDAANARDAA